MSILIILPVAAYAVTLVVLLQSLRPVSAQSHSSWHLPAVIGMVFVAFTLVTLWQEGLIRFWLNHTTSLSGNQVWFDLLIAVTLAFVQLLPRARAQRMAVLPWALAVAASASIGLLVMLVRLLWLEEKAHAKGGR